MSSNLPPSPVPPPGRETRLPDAVAIHQAHQLYCQLTGQSVRLAFDRERMWFELLRAGYTLADVRSVIGYLQREIRAQRRHVGALKLSNLLQTDRFEEDLQISQVRLRPPVPTARATPPPPSLDPASQAQGRQRALDYLRQLKTRLR